MFFKSYDGWEAVKGDDNKTVVLAKFTKADDQTVHYNSAALRRISVRQPESMDDNDLLAVRQAIKDGPLHFSCFNGWSNIGRGGKQILVARFEQAGGKRVQRGLSALQNMAANPPKKFSAFDVALLDAAIKDGPAPRR